MNESTANKTIEQAHQEAIRIHAVEMYIANEMTEEQSLQFEEHYFECDTCAQAVKAGQEFVAGIEPVPAPRPLALFAQWAPSAVAAGLLAVVGYQNTAVIPALRAQIAPQANTDILAKELEMGGESGPVSVPTESITVRFDQPEAKCPFYQADLLRERHKLVSLVLPLPPAGSPFSLHTTKRELGAGSFTVALSCLAKQDATAGQPLTERYFKVK